MIIFFHFCEIFPAGRGDKRPPRGPPRPPDLNEVGPLQARLFLMFQCVLDNSKVIFGFPDQFYVELTPRLSKMSDFPDFYGDFEVWLFLSHFFLKIVKINTKFFYINYFISRKIVWTDRDVDDSQFILIFPSLFRTSLWSDSLKMHVKERLVRNREGELCSTCNILVRGSK